jgi:cell division septation protein DedD
VSPDSSGGVGTRPRRIERTLGALAIAVGLAAGLPARAGVAELERLRAAMRSGLSRPANLAPVRILEGLRPEQRREALYLLSLVPARREKLDEALEPLVDGQDALAERAALERLHLALLGGDARRAADLAEAFRTAHPSSPALPEALLIVARSQLQAGDTARASELFLQILLRYPSSEEARLAQIGLGDCALADGKLAEAQAQFELAVKNAGAESECQARLRLVDTARRLGNPTAAAGYAKALLEACPDGLFAQEAARRWPDLLPTVPTSPSAAPTTAPPVSAAARTPGPAAGETPVAETQATPAGSGSAGFWVQIGAYAERANAERLLARLEAERGSITIDEVSLSGRTVYKVLYGPFGSEQEAQPAVHRLEQKHNLFGFVIRR